MKKNVLIIGAELAVVLGAFVGHHMTDSTSAKDRKSVV